MNKLCQNMIFLDKNIKTLHEKLKDMTKEDVILATIEAFDRSRYWLKSPLSDEDIDFWCDSHKDVKFYYNNYKRCKNDATERSLIVSLILNCCEFSSSEHVIGLWRDIYYPNAFVYLSARLMQVMQEV